MVPRILLPLIGMTLLAAVIMAEDVTESPCTSVDECNTCTNEQLKCTACSYREALLVDGSGCNDCSSNCAECADEGTAGSPDIKCTECFVGYVLNAEKECTECSTGCQYCNTTSDSTVCHTCYEPNGLGKYYARNDVDGTCLQCPTNCKKCSVQITDGVASTVCSDCIESYALNSDKVCKLCPLNCVKCSVNGDGVTICSECKAPGYVLDKTEGANKCLVCDCGEVGLCNGEQRTTDASTSKCTGCPDGKYLTSESCSPCVGGCATCETMDTNCLTCKERNYPTEELPATCSDCESNCYECKDMTSCDTCDENYGLTVSDLICEVTAVCTDSNCETCTPDVDTCSVCNEGWKVWMDGCVQRPCADPNCAMCDDDTGLICSSCAKGYGLVTGVCEECTVPNCDNCVDNAAVCTAGNCEAGYIFVDPNCDKCNKANCATCVTDGDSCAAEKCEVGYGFIGTDCLECSLANCDRCDGDETICEATKCSEGYTFVAAAGSDPAMCAQCDIANCADCNGGKTACAEDKCKSGYYFTAAAGSDPASCDECSVTLDGCAVCDDPPTMCTTCKLALVKNSDGSACYTCNVDGCTACWADDKCETDGCMDGYKYKASDMTCVQCDVNCETDPDSCSLDANEAATCSKCRAGYELNTDTGVCEACPDGCKTCTFTGGKMVCTECLDSRFSNRAACARCPSNCDECSETDGVMICGKCDDGYALNSEGNECKSCPGQCNKCAYSGGNVICQECQSGTGLSGNRQSCTACSTLTYSNCETCTSADSNEVATCLSCQYGYTFRDDEKACTACSSLTDCNICEDKPFECSSCKEGFSETEDRLCAHLCYTCEGDKESCGDFNFVGLSNRTEACFEGACVAEWDKNADTHHRGCANVTCSPSNVERCDDGICTQCCVGDTCNSFTLTGMSGANAISQTLAFVMVTLAAIGLLK